jgi:uncharacterized protein GlcG (DUF336 family)
VPGDTALVGPNQDGIAGEFAGSSGSPLSQITSLYSEYCRYFSTESSQKQRSDHLVACFRLRAWIAAEVPRTPTSVPSSDGAQQSRSIRCPSAAPKRRCTSEQRIVATIKAGAGTNGSLCATVRATSDRRIKAFTAAGHKRSTHLFNQAPNGPALPGNEAFGIQLSFEGRFAVFVGGFPVVVDREVIGGIGLSGGNGVQDTACGLAALKALQDRLGSQHQVLVQADIKM